MRKAKRTHPAAAKRQGASGTRRETADIESGAIDAASLDDEEIAESIREQFREEVSDGLAAVHVRCHGGVVTLSGEVASDELREIARLIVEDENGYEVDDRLVVSLIAGELPGETEDRESSLPEDVGMNGDVDADDITGDILEVEEEGIGFEAPSRPVPER